MRLTRRERGAEIRRQRWLDRRETVALWVSRRRNWIRAVGVGLIISSVGAAWWVDRRRLEDHINRLAVVAVSSANLSERALAATRNTPEPETRKALEDVAAGLKGVDPEMITRERDQEGRSIVPPAALEAFHLLGIAATVGTFLMGLSSYTRRRRRNHRASG